MSHKILSIIFQRLKKLLGLSRYVNFAGHYPNREKLHASRTDPLYVILVSKHPV